MPGRRCAVAVCNNSALNSRKKGLGITFHRFPKDQQTRKAWLVRCRRGDAFNLETSCVCSDHFQEDDFEENYQNELMGVSCRKTLLKSAIPSKNLGPVKDTKEGLSNRTQPIQQKERTKRKVSDLLAASSSPKPEVPEDQQPNDQPLEEKYNSLLRAYEDLKTKYDELKCSNRTLRKDISKALNEAKLEKKKKQKLEDVLKSTLSAAQEQLMIKTNKKGH